VAKAAGMIGEILGDIISDAEGGPGRRASFSNCFADLHDLDQFGGVAIQVDHVGGLAGRLGAGISLPPGHIRLS